MDRLSLEDPTFQIRHSRLGVYQGHRGPLFFWFPSSAIPVLGIYRICSQEVGMEVMDWLWSLFPDGHMDLEVYDENLNCKLVIVSGLQQMSMN